MTRKQIKEQAARHAKFVEWSDEDQCFIGRCPGLSLCFGWNRLCTAALQPKPSLPGKASTVFVRRSWLRSEGKAEQTGPESSGRDWRQESLIAYEDTKHEIELPEKRWRHFW